MSSSPLLLLHICGGGIGLLSGAVAMTFRKGSRGHRVAGNVFFVSMLCMAGAGAYMALMRSETGTVLGGVLAFYLVATGWMTVIRREGETGIFDWVAFLAALAVGAVIVTFGIEAAMSPTGTKAGIPAGMHFFFGFLALLAAAGDLRMLRRGGIFGVQRIARHLWRMCFALFAASASLFLSRPHLFPAFMRTSGMLFLLGVLPLVLMIFWLVRVRFKNVFKKIVSSYRAEADRGELRGQTLTGRTSRTSPSGLNFLVRMRSADK
jgi:hypothetical protein